jgi:hypothetical protein
MLNPQNLNAKMLYFIILVHLRERKKRERKRERRKERKRERHKERKIER